METKKGTHSAEFMLKEYERVCELWVDESHQAEQRVNFFLTITSGGTGAIILVFQLSTLSKEFIYIFAVGVLLVLLLFGVIFLNRLIARTVQVKAFQQSLAEIQDYFGQRDPEIAQYLKKQRGIYQARRYRFKFVSFIFTVLGGGLANIVVLANGLICGGITLLLLSRVGYPIQAIALWTLVTIVLSILFLCIYGLFLKGKMPIWRYY